jgi:hypothetical protein
MVRVGLRGYPGIQSLKWAATNIRRREKLMAVTSMNIAASVAVCYQLPDGLKTITRTYPDLKIASTNADIYDVISGLAGISTLQELPVNAVQRRDIFELENA